MKTSILSFLDSSMLSCKFLLTLLQLLQTWIRRHAHFLPMSEVHRCFISQFNWAREADSIFFKMQTTIVLIWLLSFFSCSSCNLILMSWWMISELKEKRTRKALFNFHSNSSIGPSHKELYCWKQIFNNVRRLFKHSFQVSLPFLYARSLKITVTTANFSQNWFFISTCNCFLFFLYALIQVTTWVFLQKRNEICQKISNMRAKKLFSIFTVINSTCPSLCRTRKCIVWSKCLIMCKGFLGTFFRCLFYFRGWVCLDVVAKPYHPVLQVDVNVSKVKSFFNYISIKWPKANSKNNMVPHFFTKKSFHFS